MTPCAHCDRPIGPTVGNQRRYCRRDECVRERNRLAKQRSRARSADIAEDGLPDYERDVEPPAPQPEPPPAPHPPVFDGGGRLLGWRVWGGGEGLAGPVPSVLGDAEQAVRGVP